MWIPALGVVGVFSLGLEVRGSAQCWLACIDLFVLRSFPLVTLSLVDWSSISCHWNYTCDSHISRLWTVHLSTLDLPLWFLCFGPGHDHDWSSTRMIWEIAAFCCICHLCGLCVLRFHILVHDLLVHLQGYFTHFALYCLHGSDYDWFFARYVHFAPSKLEINFSLNIVSCTLPWSLEVTLWSSFARTDCTLGCGWTCHSPIYPCSISPLSAWCFAQVALACEHATLTSTSTQFVLPCFCAFPL